MNSSPFRLWEEFASGGAGAIYTFFGNPWIVKGICLLVFALIVWFLLSAYRFEGRGRT
tara:strand:+ start:381 stop:554 length:174 start_codon:yes stop_codon:yes gene_type:complete